MFAANSGAGLITGQEGVRGQVSLKDAGIGGAPLFNVENACASGSSAVHLGLHYIRAGAAQCVLAIGYEKMVVADKAAPYRAIEACSDIEELAQLKAELGPDAAKRSIFMDHYARKLRTYCATSGADARHLAMIAAKNHSNGALNPNAQFRTPQTADSVLASRVVVDPLTVMMCSPISDGAAAVVIAPRNGRPLTASPGRRSPRASCAPTRSRTPDRKPPTPRSSRTRRRASRRATCTSRLTIASRSRRFRVRNRVIKIVAPPTTNMIAIRLSTENQRRSLKLVWPPAFDCAACAGGAE